LARCAPYLEDQGRLLIGLQNWRPLFKKGTRERADPTGEWMGGQMPDIATGLPSHRIDLRARGLRKPVRFDLSPDTAARAAVAGELDLLGLPALRFVGMVKPSGKDVVLEGVLTATVVQPCSVTLNPVTTRIDEAVTRRYVADWVEPEGDEVEVPEDVTVDPLPQTIDVAEVAVEALALSLPLYPRSPGADLGEAVFAPPGVTPLKAEDVRPFAGLAALKDRLAQRDEGSD